MWISHNIQAFGSIVLLCLIHLFANQVKYLGWIWHGRFLSFSGGVSFTYVFVSLLPELAKGQAAIDQAGIFPYFEKHVYLIALLGFLFFYSTQSVSTKDDYKELGFFTSMASYTVFNLLIGSAIADRANLDVQPLLLFTLAMGLHYFVNDHNLRETHKNMYEDFGRWLLTLALILGAVFGFWMPIQDTVVAILMAFAAGGVLFNVMRYELPNNDNVSYFCLGSLLYATMLMSIGVRSIFVSTS
ncbi:Uncharacterized protein PHSC3_000102 [Chlamydiales bacterium STE3]|nr:Uncharacterized protein PHSC3_000102 [Chlamydiales bacterium STE3]